MKNETARREIESLDYYLQNHTDDYSEESHTAMMMAVKVLEQQPCEDAISRQVVLDMMQMRMGGKELYKAVYELPSVIPQQKIGHWIYICNSRVNGLKIVKCSECGKRTYGSGKYCPNCGCMMKSEDQG